MLTPNELTLVVSLRGPGEPGFNRYAADLARSRQIAGRQRRRPAVMTTGSRHVFATYDNGTAAGGVAVVDVRTRGSSTGPTRNRSAARGLVFRKAAAFEQDTAASRYCRGQQSAVSAHPGQGTPSW
jgi:hypothetical protein